jgi:probable HAF family extracellular repeat protein
MNANIDGGRLFSMVLGFVAATVAPNVARAQLVDVGTLGGNGMTEALAINDVGQVVGSSFTATHESHAFLWEAGAMQDLGTLGGGGSVALAINDASQVVGQSDTATGEIHAFLWDAGVMQDLGTLGGANSFASAINDAGMVVGQSNTATGETHAFLWRSGSIRDLGTLGGSYSQARALNAREAVIGDSTTASGETHAFLWKGGVMLDLGTLGGSESHASAINVAGQVAGFSVTLSGETHAFLWKGGAMLDLGTLGGSASSARAINVAGQVAGDSETSGETHAFIWASGVMRDLGALPVPPYPGLVPFSTSNAMNASGEVTGYTSFAPHSVHAFRWSAGVLLDLGTCPALNSIGEAINEFGQVAGRCFLNVRGFMADVSTSQKAERIVDFFDMSVANGTLVAVSPKAGHAQLVILGAMLRAARGLVTAGRYAQACPLLLGAYQRLDGSSVQPDFATGYARPQVSALITNLRGTIGCR